MKKSQPCCLCSQIAGDPDNDLLSRLLDQDQPYQRRVPIETNNFVIIPSIGPLTPGHVLLCPKRHVTSFACLSADVESEFVLLKRRVAGLLSERFKAPIHCFEHGSDKNSSRVVCTVDHAHLHLFPAAAEISNVILSKFEWKVIGSELAELQEFVKEGEYLYYETPEHQCYAAKQEQEFESQIMRRLVGAALGRAEVWNWREHPGLTEVKLTYAAISPENCVRFRVSSKASQGSGEQLANEPTPESAATAG